MADKGEEGWPTRPSAAEGRDLPGGSPGAAQAPILAPPGAPFLTLRLRAGSWGRGGERLEPQPSLSPSPQMLGCCWGHSPSSRCQPCAKGGTDPCLCCPAELLLPPNLPRSPRRGQGRWKTMATAIGSPSPAAFEVALAISRAEHHPWLALHQTMGPFPLGWGATAPVRG